MKNNHNHLPSSPPPGWETYDEIHLRDYVQVLHRRWRLIVLIFVGVLSATLLATLWMKPLYQADAILEIQKSTGGAMSLQNLFSDSMQLGGSTEEVNTEVEILKSRTVALDAARLSSYQLVLDRSERIYQKLIKRILDRLKGLFVSEEEDKSTALQPPPEPLRLEAVELPLLSQSLTFELVFTDDSSFRLLDDEGQLLGQGQMGKVCSTPLFSFTIQGSLPANGRTYDLTLSPLNSASKNLQDRLQVSPVRNTRLIRLQLTASHPDEAQALLASVLTAYQQLKIHQKTQMASRALEFIDQQLDAVDAEMQTAVDELKLFKEKHQLVNLSESAKVAIEQLAELEKSQQELMLLGRQAKLLLTALQKEQPLDRETVYALGNTLNQPMLLALAGDLSQLETERAALRSQYTERHPAIQAQDKKIAQLKAKLEAEVQSLIASLEGQRTEFAQEIKGAEKGLEKLPEAEQRLADLTRQASVYQKTYAFMVSKKEELELTRASQIGDVWVAEDAYAMPGFIKPRPVMNLMLAAVLGLVLGIGLAFFLEYLDDSVKNPEDIQAAIQLPVLGTVGQYSFAQDGQPAHRRYLPTLGDSRSQIAEAFRTFRSNLLFTNVDQPHRLMLLTSSLPDEGKTTCAANLAVVLSHLGKRVLLVDTDLRKPVIHRIFECKRSPGLVNVLVEEDWQKSLDQTIQPTQVKHLDFLACGDVPPNPNEMLGSEKMGHVIEHLRQRYDFVLFDSPPLLSVSDAAVLARRLDGVLLVVRGGSTPRNVLKEVAEMLRKARTEILGVVLNGIDFKKERYYYYYRQYYAYGEGDKTAEPKGKFAFVSKFFNRKSDSVEDGKQ